MFQSFDNFEISSASTLYVPASGILAHPGHGARAYSRKGRTLPMIHTHLWHVMKRDGKKSGATAIGFLLLFLVNKGSKNVFT